MASMIEELMIFLMGVGIGIVLSVILETRQ